MKYVEHRMSVDAGPTASTSLHKWLGRELEVRGIDAVIYTRYILSILQQDNADDMEHSDAIYFPPMSRKQGLHHQSGGGGAGVKAKGRYHGTVGRGMVRDRSPGSGKGCGSSMNAEEMKKSAVMECLLSVSDQDVGIERLVEELCLKLKENKTEEATASPFSDLDTKTQRSRETTPSDPLQDPYQKYYAAFPALKEPSDNKGSTVDTCTCENQKLWSRLAVKLQSSAERESSPQYDITQSHKVEADSPIKWEGGRSKSGHDDESKAEKRTRNLNVHAAQGKVNQVSILNIRTTPDTSPVVDTQAVKLFRYGLCERCVHLKTLLGMKTSPDVRDALLDDSCKQSPDWKDVNGERPTFVIPKVNSSPVSPSLKDVSGKEAITSDGDGEVEACPILNVIADKSTGADLISEDSSWYTNPIDGLLSVRPSGRLYRRRSSSELDGTSVTEVQITDDSALSPSLFASVDSDACGRFDSSSASENTKGYEMSISSLEFGPSNLFEKNENDASPTLLVFPRVDEDRDIKKEIFPDDLDGSISLAEDLDDLKRKVNDGNFHWPIGDQKHVWFAEVNDQPEAKDQSNLHGDGAVDDASLHNTSLSIQSSRLLKLFANEPETYEDKDEMAPYPAEWSFTLPGHTSLDTNFGENVWSIPRDKDCLSLPPATCPRDSSKLVDVMLLSTETADSDSGIADDKPSGDELAVGALSNATDDEAPEVEEDMSLACDVERLISTPAAQAQPHSHRDVRQVQMPAVQQEEFLAKSQVDEGEVKRDPIDREVDITSDIEGDKVVPLHIEGPNEKSDGTVVNGNEGLKSSWHSEHKLSSVWESRLLDLNTTDLQSGINEYDICDKCSNNRASSAGQSPVGNFEFSGTRHSWSCYCARGGRLTPTNVHSYSTWYDLHATDSTYDDDRPLREVLDSILSSPPKTYLHRHTYPFIPSSYLSSSPSSPLWSPSSSLAQNQTFQLWDVNSQKHFHEFDQLKDRPHMVDIIKENVLGYSLGWPQLSNNLFIQGGLYGNTRDLSIWDPSQAEGTANPSTSAFEDEVFEDTSGEHSGWQRLGDTLPPPAYSHQKSISLSELCSEDWLGLPKLDRRHFSLSSEILPSEHSAFQDNIPSRLPHVLSEPFLSPSKQTNEKSCSRSEWDRPCRFVQVKHLFRSESFLAQCRRLTDDCSGIAGLSAEIGVNTQEEAEERQDLLFSPDTHFRPIQTPKTNTTPVQTPDTAAVNKTCVASKDLRRSSSIEEEEPVMIVDGENYQVYTGGASAVSRSSDGSLDTPTCEFFVKKRRKFVPKFKVKTDWEKFSQTDCNHASSANTPDAGRQSPVNAVEDEGTMLARLTAGISDVLEFDHDLSLDDHCVEDGSHSDGHELAASDAEDIMTTHHNQSLQVVDQYPLGLSNADISNLWTDSYVDVAEELSADVSGSLASYKNIWSVGDSYDNIVGSLPASFPSIPDLDNARLFPIELGSRTSVDEDVSGEKGEKTPTPTSFQRSENDDSALSSADVGQSLSRSWAAYDGSDEQMFAFDFELGAQADGMAWFSSDLEGEWLSSDTPFEVQVPRKKQRSKQGAYKKPCSFFLEGQCRRSDCKFAHDTSNITCRFWEDGDCFKGITCPFLHGYPSEKLGNRLRDSSKSGDFLLETEDFPELSKSQEEQLVKITSKPIKKRKKSNGSTKDKENILDVGPPSGHTVNKMSHDTRSPVSQASKKSAANREKSRAKSLPIEIKQKK